MNLALVVALAALGQFSQIDTNADGVPNIYRWRGAAEWQLTTTPGTAGQCLVSGGAGVAPAWGSCAAGGGYATIQDEGGALTVRTILNFTGAGVTCVDNGGATRTDCTIPGGGGAGDVVGPASATDNAIARFDGTTGKLIQNSVVTVEDTTGQIGRPAAAGLNQAGSDLRVAGGAGTGNGTPGLIYLSAPSLLGSGSTVQTILDRFILGGSTTTTTLLLGDPDADNQVATPVTTAALYATSGNSTNDATDLEISAGHAYGNSDGGDLLLQAGSTISANPDTGGNVKVAAGNSVNGAGGEVQLWTGTGSGFERLTVARDGNWELSNVAGAAGQVPVSAGAGAPMIWSATTIGAAGTTTVDFGAHPADPIATRVITGQTGIVAGSVVQAWLYPLATADHTLDEHLVVDMKVHAHTIVAGTGFTITAVYRDNDNARPGSWPSGAGGSQINGTRTYGQWSVGWRWQ